MHRARLDRNGYVAPGEPAVRGVPAYALHDESRFAGAERVRVNVDMEPDDVGKYCEVGTAAAAALSSGSAAQERATHHADKAEARRHGKSSKKAPGAQPGASVCVWRSWALLHCLAGITFAG